MHPRLAADLDRLPSLLDTTVAAAARGLASLEDRPVAVAVPIPALVPVPEHGIGLGGALTSFAETWEAGLSGSAGPRYLGFVTGGATPASVAGDWLASAYDQNVAAGGDSLAPELQRQTLTWLAELFGIGTAHRGSFVTGATVSNTVGLAIAREWIGEQLGADVSRDGVAALGPVTVLSGTPHSSIPKAMSVLGLGRDRLQRVPTLLGREAVDVVALETALASLDGKPAIVVANAGTVNTVDFDDLRAIAALRERYPFWLHVDGSFGAFAALSPEHAHLVDGLDLADSICLDLHKWLNVPYDAAVQFSRRLDLQTKVFQNTASYLTVVGDDPDLIHLTPENSQRFRALPTWFSLVAYGREGHREIVERDIALARALGDRIDADQALRLLAPVRLNVVCLTLAQNPTPERVNALAAAVAASGEAFLTGTVYDGTPGLRAAFCNWSTSMEDVELVHAALAKAAELCSPVD
ncbi:pyridoxal phosphate-dependent decarboxylase family protein [Agromyces bauzanensis]|uniref:Aspartate aminotransferase family protein n=1 Tax=Agromyces bauzanensis TaxID=1308924 RepID=A0A917UT32_9MICO|nr:pyridoxal-dependent decarboxylase [Agromyces bauzanensis]GGJ83335.1 aspartate aminotransferase family protein [Agromyces bauzanensis]